MKPLGESERARVPQTGCGVDMQQHKGTRRSLCMYSHGAYPTNSAERTIDGATSNREQEAKLVAFINRHFSIY